MRTGFGLALAMAIAVFLGATAAAQTVFDPDGGKSAPMSNVADKKLIRWANDPKCSHTREVIKFAQDGASATAGEDEFLKWAWLARFIAEYGATDYSLMAPSFDAPENAT